MYTEEELLQTKTTDELIAMVKKPHRFVSTNVMGAISNMGIMHHINVVEIKSPQGELTYRITWSDGFHPEKIIASEDELRKLLVQEIGRSAF